MLKAKKNIFLLMIFFAGSSVTGPFFVFSQVAGDYRAVGGANWSVLTTWERYSGATWATPTAGEGYPGQNSGTGNVNIQNGLLVTLDVSPANAIGSFSISATTTNTQLSFSGSNALNVSNVVSYSPTSANGINNTIAVGSGTLNCGSVSMPNTTVDSRDCYLTISTGTVTSTGAFLMSGSANRNAVIFSGAGLLQVGGSMTGGVLTASTGTVEFSSAGGSSIDNYAFNNIGFSGAGTKTLLGNTTAGGTFTMSGGTLVCAGFNFIASGNAAFSSGSITSTAGHLTFGGTTAVIDGNITITTGGNLTFSGTSVSIGGAVSMATGDLSISGSLTVSGSLDNTSGTGVNSISGDVTVIGAWNNTGNDDFSIGGSLVVNGTFNSGTGTYTMSGASKSISGTTSPITFAGDLSVSGSVTNNGTVAIGASLTGAGSFSQAASRTLYIGDDISITSFVATTVPNTVIYNSSTPGTHSFKGTVYHHLTISSTAGSPVLAGNITVNGDFSVTSGASVNVSDMDITVSGNTTLTGTIVMTDGSSTTNSFQALTIDGGTLDQGASTFDFTTVNGNFTVTSNGGTVDDGNFTVIGTSAINGLFTLPVDGGVITFQGAVIVNAGGSWLSTGLTLPAGLIFQNGITNNGTSFSAGAATFNTNNQALASGTSISFSRDVVLTGVTVTNNTNVNLTYSATNTLSGTGTWSQAASAASILNFYGADMTGITLNASAAGNTVNYYRNSVQTIYNTVYYHLKVSTSSVKELSAATTVLGDVLIADLAALSAGPSNAVSYDMNVRGNWNSTSTDPIPYIPRIRTVTFNGTSSQTISNTGDAQGTEFYNVTINNTSSTGVTLSGTAGNNLIIPANGTLILTDGYIYTTSSNLVQIDHNGASSPGSASSFVDGPVKKIGNAAFVFPVGDDRAPVGSGAEDVWARLGVSAAVSTSTEFTAHYFRAPYSDLTFDGTLLGTSSVEYWTLDRAGSANNVNVTLYFEDASSSGISDYTSTDLVVSRYNGADWVDNGQSSISGTNPGSVTSNVVSTYNTQFSFGSKTGLNPLPVELITFSAEMNGNQVDLKWMAQTEMNSNHFIVQRSMDGVLFQDLSSVNAAGNSSTPKYYAVVDPEPFQGVSYYRLKEVDNDGKTFFSNPIAVQFGAGSISGMSVFPNPTDGPFNISLTGWNGKQALIVVRDVQGKEFFSKIVILSNDHEVVAIDPSGKLSSGVYFVVATSDSNIFEKKLIIR